MAHFAVEDDRPQDAVAAEQAFQERVRARHREAQKAQERARLEAEREAKRAESRAAEEEESRPTATASSPQRKALRGAVGSSEAPAASRGADHVDAAAAAGSEAEDDSLSDTSSGAESEGAMHPQRRRAAVRRQLEEQAQTLSSSRAAPPVSDPALRRRSRESARGARSRYAGMATLQALGAEDEEEYWALREEPVREGTGPSREATAAPAPGSAPANGRDGGMRAQSRRAQRHLDARASRKGPDVARERGQGGAAGIGEDPAPGARSRGSHGRSKPRHVRHRDRVAHLATVDRSSDLVRPGGTRGGSRSLRRAQALAKRLGLSLKEALGREEERLILRTVPERVSFGEVPEGWHLVATITLRNHTEEVARYRVARPRVTTAADVDASLTGAEAREPVWAQPNTVTVVQAPGGVAAGMDKAMAVHLRARQVGEVEERVEIVTEHETLVVPVHAVVTASQESPGGAAQQGSPAAGAGIRVVGRVRGWEKHWSARGRSVEERKLSVGTASARGGDEGRGGRSAAESGDGPSVETTPSSEAAPPVVTGEGRQANPSPADAAAPAGPDRRTGTNDAPGGSAASSPGEAAPQGNVSPAPPAAPSRTSAPASGPHLGPTAGMTDAEREAADDEAERHLLQEMARSSRR